MANPQPFADPKPVEADEVQSSVESQHHHLDDPLARVLDLVDGPSERPPLGEGAAAGPAQTAALVPVLALGRFKRLEEGTATVELLGSRVDTVCDLAPHLDPKFLEDCHTDGFLALLSLQSGNATLMGVVQTGYPQKRVIAASDLELRGTDQVTVRSGRAAIQMKSDGSMELFGTNIRATSRGIFRIIGRALRLN